MPIKNTPNTVLEPKISYNNPPPDLNKKNEDAKRPQGPFVFQGKCKARHFLFLSEKEDGKTECEKFQNFYKDGLR